MYTTRLSFLGPAQFCRHDQIVTLNIGKGQALLAYLALTDAAQTRDHLLDLLWTESHPDAARKNLRNTLWRLRRQLGDDLFTADDDRILLSSSVWTDVSAFESLLLAQPPAGPERDGRLWSALDLWRGPLLEGLKLSDAPDFELWLNNERARFGQIYLGVLGQLLDQYRAAFQWQEVITVAQRALAYDNTQESIHASLMEAYARLGQRTDALRQYDRLRTVLERELDMQPLPTTRSLRAQILGGELGRSKPSAHDSTSSKFLSVSGQHERPVHPFVGRQVERAMLDEAMQLAAQGQLQIVLLTGELGIGKSTLWQQWSAGIDAETTVLEARCLEPTQTLPFAPLTALFGTQICMQQFAGPASPVSPVWLTELTRLLPHIREYRADLPPAIPLPPEEERRRLFEAFAQTLRSLAAAPLILFIDDLHWADQATLDWLVYLTDRLRDHPILLVGVYRDNEAQPALEDYVARWRREHAARRLSLAPFTVQEATELIAALDGDMEMVNNLHTQSGGNPYYLTELSRVHADGVPTALVDLLSARLRGLPESAQRLLQTAAILEPTISFDMLHSISQQSEDETLDALDMLLDMAVLIERGERYEFAHPLLARIVRDELSVPRRKRLHQRVAEHLRTVYADEVESIVGQLTRHFAAAGNGSEAARYAEQAAARATQLGAMTEAVNFYRQAYTLAPAPDRQLALGYALMHIPGGVDEARAAMQQALAESESRQDQKGIVQAGLRLAFSYLSTEQGEQVLYWAQRILVASTESDDIELHATAEYLMAAGKFNSQHAMVEADAHYAEATRLATEHNLHSDIAIQSWFGWGNLSVQCGEYAHAKAKFERTLALAQSAGNVYFESLCYNNLAYATLLGGDVAGARAAIDRGLDFIESNQLLRPRQYLYSTRGEIALAEGDFAAAESWFFRAIKEARIYDNETHAINVRAHLGRVAQARGDVDRAKEALTEALAAIPAGSALFLRTQIELWLAELHLQRNEINKAEAYLNAARERLAGSQRMAQQKVVNEISERLCAASKRQKSIADSR